MKPKKPNPLPAEPEEWDLSEWVGVLPQEIPLTHNLGCVRSPKSPSAESSKNQSMETDSKKPRGN
ncbi:MAG: hypothetical protein NWQ52_07840 [Algoriphagus sp.]|jgi:hypothetical protein|uniref:hypothetical protein n=1 Tax=Algoriphagus sp. TaxID=1872435 RepID=UPI0027537AAF|nr:hypothetical protein [Algoriphagus sp.]